MATMFPAFGEEMMIPKATFEEIMAKKLGQQVKEDYFEEFLRHMSEVNRLMVDGEDIYVI